MSTTASQTRTGARWLQVVGVLAGVNAVAALGGSIGLVTGTLTLGDLTERLPLGSSVLGGIALALLVCAPQSGLALAAWRRSELTAALSLVVGVAMVGWIGIQVAFLRVFAGLQVAYVVVGLAQVALGLQLGRHVPGVPARQLVSMVATVIADVPRFLGAPLVRTRHLRWGATDAEVSRSMPGDSLVENASYVATRALDVEAPPEDVWPWLVQVGADRAGWYSNDLLDHQGRPSSARIDPAWQDPAVGDVVAMSGRTPPPPGTYFVVHSFEQPRWLLWAKSDSTWSWRLEPAGGGGCRLVTRVRARYDWHHPASALAGVLLMELGDYAMMRRMLLGIRARAAPTLDQVAP